MELELELGVGSASIAVSFGLRLAELDGLAEKELGVINAVAPVEVAEVDIIET